MRSYLLVILLFSCFHAFAQSGTISGKIVDKESQEVLIGASALLQGTTLGSVTDLNGVFTIKNVKPGNYTLVIKYIGYTDVSQSVRVAEGQQVSVPDIILESSSLNLAEIEVFANVVDDRKTPVAIANIGALEINEQLGGMQLPELLNSTPGVYATQGDGAFGDAYVNVRGFGQEEILFMINGVPMNDMENGIMYWSNFAGLSEVTRNMQIQRGLGASKLAVNSVGGTINIVTTPADRKAGGNAELTFANASYSNRYRFTLNSGLLDGGWAFTFQGSRSVGEGIRPGAFVDAWSYFLSASKQINEKHTLLFTAFGAPSNRGRAWNTNTETYQLYDSYQYNEAWGYYNGQKFNTSQNKSHKPQLTLMHLWNINSKLTATTSIYASMARVYGTSVLRGQGVPVMGLTTEGQQNIEAMRDASLANERTINNPYGMPLGSSISGAQSQYILEGRYNNHNWYGAISNLNYQLNETTSIVAGIDLRDYTAAHFARIQDLLGGEFWLDVDRFTGEDNNLLTPNRVAYKGDKIRYDYDGHVRWGSAFAQLEKTINKLDVFASANYSRIQMWRVGNMWSGVQDPDFSNVYIYNSLGASDKRVFTNYNVKAGVNYRITGRHNVFVNGGTFTRAPFLRNAFEQPEYSNNYLEGLRNEDIAAIEAGYSYRTGRFRANLNFYYTQWNNKAFVNTSTNDFVNPTTGERQAVTGISALHKGIEIDFRYEPTQGLEITGMFSKGDWRWTNDASVVFTNEQGAELKSLVIYTKGLRVGNSAQTTAFLGAHYKRLRNAYFGFRLNYFTDLYELFDPAERITGYKDVRKLPDYYILDVYGGYYFNVGELRARAAANVHNLLNDNFIRRSDERFGGQESYGFPLNFNATLTVYF